MKKCIECDRPLNEKEETLCPACESNKSFNNKKWTEYLAAGALLIGGLVLTIIKSKVDDSA